LEALTVKVVSELGLDAQIDHVTAVVDIMKYSVMSTPGLVINEKVVSAGRIPSEAEIRDWLKG